MSKKIVIVIILLVFAFILLVIGSFISTRNTKSIKQYKNNLYCSTNGMCYKYDGLHLNYYEDEDETEKAHTDLLQKSCIYTRILNTCREDIMTWDKEKIYIKKNNHIHTYYNVGEDLGKPMQLDLTGKAYKNDQLDLFFINKVDVIVSGKQKAQSKCHYSIYAYEFDQYASLRYECSNKNYDKEDNYNNYSFEIKKDEIIGFKKAKKEELNRIDFSYFDQDYNYIIDDKYYIVGHYISDKNKEELWFDKDKVKIKSFNSLSGEYNTNEYTVKIAEVNDKYVLYDFPTSGYKYYYDLKKKKICTYKECYKSID